MNFFFNSFLIVKIYKNDTETFLTDFFNILLNNQKKNEMHIVENKTKIVLEKKI